MTKEEKRVCNAELQRIRYIAKKASNSAQRQKIKQENIQSLIDANERVSGEPILLTTSRFMHLSVGQILRICERGDKILLANSPRELE